jgi:hypothetical protein
MHFSDWRDPMQLDTEQIVVLIVTAVAIAPLVWVERRSRRNRNAQTVTSPPEPIETPKLPARRGTKA